MCTSEATAKLLAHAMARESRIPTSIAVEHLLRFPLVLTRRAPCLCLYMQLPDMLFRNHARELNLATMESRSKS